MEKISILIKHAAVVFPVVFLMHCSGTRPSVVNQGAGKLADCPQTPNCVLSTSTITEHAISPLKYTASLQDAMKKLVSAVNSMKRTKIITQSENYLYVEFTSAFWRFVDDVEFSFDDANKTIHFRSASRLGKSDFGVNRKRMEEIRKRFTNQ